MIARLIEVNLKPERYNEFRTLFENEILPVLKRQNGFLDSVSMLSDDNKNRAITVSLWKSKTDAENYQKREFSRVIDMLKPFLASTPTVQYFNVEHTTFRKVESVAA